MNRLAILEAQRLLRRANEVNQDAAALAIKAMQLLCEAGQIPVHTMYCVNQAVPGAAQTEKEREVLAQ